MEKEATVLTPGQIQVTQTDMLAQIGALTMEVTVLRSQIAQMQQIIGEQAGRIAELEPPPPDAVPEDGALTGEQTPATD